MEFKGPSPDLTRYIGKFFTVGDRAFIADINDPHNALKSEAMAALSETGELNNLDDSLVDAGFVSISDLSKRIRLSDCSDSLRLPNESTANEARKRSVTIFQRLAPQYKVIGEAPYRG